MPRIELWHRVVSHLEAIERARQNELRSGHRQLHRAAMGNVEILGCRRPNDTQLITERHEGVGSNQNAAGREQEQRADLEQPTGSIASSRAKRKTFEYPVDPLTEAADSEHERRFLVHSHLGDYALYLTGLGRGWIEYRLRYGRSSLSVDYYRDMGRRAFPPVIAWRGIASDSAAGGSRRDLP